MVLKGHSTKITAFSTFQYIGMSKVLTIRVVLSAECSRAARAPASGCRFPVHYKFLYQTLIIFIYLAQSTYHGLNAAWETPTTFMPFRRLLCQLRWSLLLNWLSASVISLASRRGR
jgi:hypothetical protein